MTRAAGVRYHLCAASNTLKNGSMMAYVTVEDESASIELIVSPRSLQQWRLFDRGQRGTAYR